MKESHLVIPETKAYGEWHIQDTSTRSATRRTCVKAKVQNYINSVNIVFLWNPLHTAIILNTMTQKRGHHLCYVGFWYNSKFIISIHIRIQCAYMLYDCFLWAKQETPEKLDESNHKNVFTDLRKTLVGGNV